MVKATTTASIPGLPAGWADAPLLPGVSVWDKSELVDKVFLVTAVKQTLSSGGYPMVWVEGELTDGRTFTFNDSSALTGVRADVEAILIEQKKADLLDEWIPLRFVCPEGLRVSNYLKADSRGKDQPARTYYLTRSGQRA